MHYFVTEKIPAQAFMTRFPGLVHFCAMSFIYALFFVLQTHQRPDYRFLSFGLVDAFFLRKSGMSDIISVHPKLVKIISSGAS